MYSLTSSTPGLYATSTTVPWPRPRFGTRQTAAYANVHRGVTYSMCDKLAARSLLSIQVSDDRRIVRAFFQSNYILFTCGSDKVVSYLVVPY
jgi:hypothetical protein